MTRQEAIEWFKESPFYHDKHEPFKLAIEALEAEPVKHGKWVYNQYDADPKIGNWHCSVCREISIERRLHSLEYCPHCGARMDGEENV